MNTITTNGPRSSTGTSIAAKPLRQVANVRELLVNDQAKQQIAAVAAKHMNPERMLRMMANSLRTTPQLAECEPLSLLGSMMTCASLGLEANTPLGHCYLIPFKNRRKNITEVQLIIGYKGMIDLARRSGHIVNIHGDVVYESDDFSFEYGSNQHLTHRPRGKRVKPIYAYCHAKLTDGEAFTVLPWEEVMAIRDASQGYKTAIQYGKKDTPWIAHEHEMAAKTAVRALFKYLPISIEMDGGKLSDALAVDDHHVDFSSFAKSPDEGHIIDGEAQPEDDDQGFDPETGEVGGAPVIEDRRGQETVIETRPERQPEPVQQRQTARKTEPKQQARHEPAPQDQGLALDHTDSKPMEDRPSRTAPATAPAAGSLPLEDLPAMIVSLERSIKQDLDDGADLESTLDVFRNRLNAIKNTDAVEYEALIEDVTSYSDSIQKMSKGGGR